MDYKKLGAAIGAALKKSELSASVGEFSGVTTGAVNGWCRGHRPYEANVAGYFRIIKALKIDVSEFANHETPAGRIAFLRFKNEFSIADLMRLCGKSRSVFSELESGARIVSPVHVKYLAPALNTTPAYILFGDKKEPLRNGLVSVAFPIAKQIVLDANKIGVTLYLKDGCLFANPSSLLNDPIKLKIREHKVQLIDFLSQNPLLCTTHVDNFESTPAPFAIDIYIKSIGNDDVNAVNARELWAKLGVRRDFSNWIKDRIGKYDFLEGTDYAVAKIGERESSGFQPIDYFISLDMAKELSMVENNDQGKLARRYFIECEKRAKTTAPKIDHLSPEVIAALKQARTVQLAMGMTKVQSREYASDLIQDRFGFDMERATTSSHNQQLRLRIVT